MSLRQGYGGEAPIVPIPKKNAVSEQVTKQPTIETGVIRKARIWTKLASKSPSDGRAALPSEGDSDFQLDAVERVIRFSNPFRPVSSVVDGIAIVAFGSAAILASLASLMGNVRAAP
ncbi:MAG: hypothetical protein J6M56_05860 [Clostridia bacterium]|nr:hypothetical protein [Clostridia bacterium]